MTQRATAVSLIRTAISLWFNCRNFDNSQQNLGMNKQTHSYTNTLMHMYTMQTLKKLHGDRSEAAPLFILKISKPTPPPSETKKAWFLSALAEW